MERKIKATKEELNNLKINCVSMGLISMEINCKREVNVDLHKLVNLNCIIKFQRSCNRWLKQEDVNSKYFHGCINKIRKDNEIITLEVNGRIMKEENETKNKLVIIFIIFLREEVWNLFQPTSSSQKWTTWIRTYWFTNVYKMKFIE